MKNIKNITLITVLASILFSACDPNGYLGVKPRGKDIPTEYKHFDGLLVSFNMLRWSTFMDVLYFPPLSDEFTVTERSLGQLTTLMGNQGKLCYEYNRDYLLPDDLPDDWGYNNNIYIANLVINNVMNTNANESEKLSTQSEARMLRAWYLFRNAQIYLKPYDDSYAENEPGLPIVTEANTMQETFNRGTMKELFDFIVNEMEESCPNIANNTCYSFRIEKADAYTMLGQVYHYMNKYDKALVVMRLAKQYADDTGAAKFYNLNEIDEANIRYDGISIYDKVENMRNLYVTQSCLSRYYPNYTTTASLYAKPEYSSLFGKTDRRQYRFLNENGLFRPCSISYVQMGVTSYDLYLILAECEARTGNKETARDLLKVLRENRMPTEDAPVPAEVDSKEKLIKFCVEESIREHLGDGHFYFTMKRLWNDTLFTDLKAGYCHKIIDTGESFLFKDENLEMNIPETVLKWNNYWIY